MVQLERLQLRVGRGGATVNDVEVHGSTALHAGDVISDGDVQYLVLPAPNEPSTEATPLLDHWSWQRRVEEEIAAPGTGFSVLLGRSGAFSPAFLRSALATFSPSVRVRKVPGAGATNVLQVLLVGDAASVDSLRQHVADAAAREEETVRWGAASFPRHGSTAEELWSVAVDRLLALESPETSELVWSDPCMTRLRAFADRWSRSHRLMLVGPEGAGRETLARVIRGLATPAAPFVVHRGARFDPTRWKEDVARAEGGALHVRRPEILPEGERKAFWTARNFRPSVGSTGSDATFSTPGSCIVIPDLASRPADVAPIAELAFHLVDAQLGRRRSGLRAETRSVLQSFQPRENVRSLRNLAIRGALNATSPEVRPEHLELPWPGPASSSIRTKVNQMERREIESVLHTSAWNVTEAARRMNIPRRTLVYRMARLGLKRPKGYP